MSRSAVECVRSGEWRVRRLTMLAVLAVASVLLDVATTYVVLRDPAYVENNPILVAIAGVDPLLATAYQLLVAGAIALTALLSFGWLSRVAGVYVLATNGTLGVNNVVLFLTGSALYELVGIDVGLATTVLTPVVGIALGLAWEYRDHGLPWGEVLLAAVAVGPLSITLHVLV